MIVPREIQRAEAAASRVWQLVFEAREFLPSFLRALRIWSQSSSTTRRLWVEGVDPRRHRFQVANSRRLSEQRSAHDLLGRLPVLVQELRSEVALARQAGAFLDRECTASARSELAAAVAAARPLCHMECPPTPPAPAEAGPSPWDLALIEGWGDPAPADVMASATAG